MKKILITGNSGYIGSHLTKMLQPYYEIYGIDINEPKILPTNQQMCDIRSIILGSDMVFDAVIHLAALVKINEGETNPIDYYTTNIDGTLKVLKHFQFKNFIFASTGSAEHLNSVYSVSKKAAEDCVREYLKSKSVPYTIFRFYNVIGTDGFNPTNPDGLMYNLMKSKYTGKFMIFGNDYNTTDGTCLRDYVHVNEICAAIQTAINIPANGLENLGHGVGYSVKQIVDLFSSVNDVKLDVTYTNRRAGDLEKSVLDKPSPYMIPMYSIEQLLKI